MAKIVAALPDVKRGDRVTLKPMELKKYKGYGFEYATVERVWTSQADGKKFASIKAKIGEHTLDMIDVKYLVLKND